MFFAELDGNKVRHVGGGDDYTILPPQSIEIPSMDAVHEGMIYEDGEFREPTTDEFNSIYRSAFDAQRNALFSETVWIRERHLDRLELDIDDADNWADWLAYWQTLRDMPEQPGFDPEKPEWPEKPE
jgi:hypothetical protein